jgi:hypothetical protein
MAFIGLMCSDGAHREVICFASNWPDFADSIRPGQLARFRLVKDKRSLFLDSEIQGAFRLLE